jgi:hypothetical protein
MIDIDIGEEWQGVCSFGERHPKQEVVCWSAHLRRNRVVENRHAEGRIRREAGGKITTSWPGGVLALIRGGRGAEDWMAAAAEPSILCHGWGGRNGEIFWLIVVFMILLEMLSHNSHLDKAWNSGRNDDEAHFCVKYYVI